MSKRWLFIVAAVLMLLALSTTVALAAPLTQSADGTSTQDELWLALAPLLAIATAVERVLEQFWNRWEEKDVWPNNNGVADTGDKTYIEFKMARTHWLGFAIAMVAVALTDARFFRLLNLDVLFSSGTVLFSLGVGGIFDNFTWGSLIDWLLTAGIVGWGGTELTHSLIEGLVKSRNLWKEMKEVQSGERSLQDVKFFQDVIAPQLEKIGISTASLRQALTTLDSVGISADKLISHMTTGQVDELLAEMEGNDETKDAAQAVRALLEGTPGTGQLNPVQLGQALEKIAPEMRQRFLGA